VLVVPTCLNVFCSHHVYNITFPSVSLQLRSIFLTQYYSGDKIEKNEMGGVCSAYGEGRGVYRVLLGKPEGEIFTQLFH